MNPRSQRSIPDCAFQILLVVSTLVISWLGMMVVHEFGHVLFAWLSGGSVARVVLSPLEFSRTDLERLGLFPWNGLGPPFGLGRAAGKVERKPSIATFVCLLLLIVVELLTYTA